MKRRISSSGSGRKEPVLGMSTHTFVRSYQGHSQMDVNTINGARLSSSTCNMLEKLYEGTGKNSNTQT